MKLTLTRPLAFIDIESTGLNVTRDRIVEISILIYEPDGTQNTHTFRINPEMPISEEASAIHGITNEMVATEPTFETLAPTLFDLVKNADLAGFNSNKFDVPMLTEEFLRAGIDFDIRDRQLIDVQNIFHKMEQRTLVAAYKFYCDKSLEDAHSAEADIKATAEVFMAQLERYDELEPNVDFLSAFSKFHDTVDTAGRIVRNERKQECFNFGKYKGRALEIVFKTDPGYYGWLMNGDFPQFTKKIFKEIMDKVKAERASA